MDATVAIIVREIKAATPVTSRFVAVCRWLQCEVELGKSAHSNIGTTATLQLTEMYLLRCGSPTLALVCVGNILWMSTHLSRNQILELEYEIGKLYSQKITALRDKAKTK